VVRTEKNSLTLLYQDNPPIFRENLILYKRIRKCFHYSADTIILFSTVWPHQSNKMELSLHNGLFNCACFIHKSTLNPVILTKL
jgi:hypothetical protein